MKSQPPNTKKTETGKQGWLKKLGLAGILFFVIKGCISTALIILASQGLLKGCQ